MAKRERDFSNSQKHDGGRVGTSETGAPSDDTLSTAGELVQRGGLAGGLTMLLYIVVGGGFWSLVGWGADHLLGTGWLVIVGAVLGAAAGIYLGYLHMREGLNSSSTQMENPTKTSKSDQGPTPRV
ncbi:AtpZ/AtpI family protein [Kocuria atrinae]|uniref:AtpZ/AtpI family protein n=1 Tax=Kocuria atrinae TaxID=592377 RepID=A0ABN2XCP3_9MICC